MSARHDQINRVLRKLHELWLRDERRTLGQVVALATPPVHGETWAQPALHAADEAWEHEIDLMLSDPEEPESV